MPVIITVNVLTLLIILFERFTFSQFSYAFFSKNHSVAMFKRAVFICPCEQMSCDHKSLCSFVCGQMSCVHLARVQTGVRRTKHITSSQLSPRIAAAIIGFL